MASVKNHLQHLTHTIQSASEMFSYLVSQGVLYNRFRNSNYVDNLRAQGQRSVWLVEGRRGSRGWWERKWKQSLGMRLI